MSAFPFPQNLSPKLIQFEQIPETFKPTEVHNPGVGGFAPPVKRTNQRTGGQTGTFVSGKQLEHALAGLVSPNLKLPTASQVLQTYPIHEARPITCPKLLEQPTFKLDKLVSHIAHSKLVNKVPASLDPDNNLIFISHDLKAKKSIAVGGSFDLNSFQRNLTDQVLIKGINVGDLNPPLDDNFQDTWQQGPFRDRTHKISGNGSHVICISNIQIQCK